MEAQRGPQQPLEETSHFHQLISSTMLGLCRAHMTEQMLIQDVDMEALKAIKTTNIKLQASII